MLDYSNMIDNLKSKGSSMKIINKEKNVASLMKISEIYKHPGSENESH